MTVKTVMFPELAGSQEVAQILGVSRQQLRNLIARGDFPEPVAQLACGPVWLADNVRAYVRPLRGKWLRKPR